MSTAGVDVPVDLDRLPGEHGRDAAARFCTRVALRDGDRQWSFAEFWRDAESLAAGLRKAGCCPGDRLALWMGNCAEFLLLSLATEIAGLVRVPLNARYTRTEVAAILADCAPVLVAADASRARRLPQDQPVVVTGRPEWAELFADQSRVELYTSRPDELCSLNYTSGSTGKPKGVMLTHRNWMAVYRNLLIDRDIRGDDRLLHYGPLSHASGAYFMPFFLSGATSAVSEPRIGGLLRSLERERSTVLTCVPSLLTRLLVDARSEKTSLAHLRQIGFGGEPMPANTLKSAIAKFGPILVPNYGLTEAMMTVCTLPAEQMLRDGEPRANVLGRAYRHVEIELRDADGRPVPDGEIGELCVRADHVMQGYWNRPDETAAVLRDGWLYSGDLARRDADGVFTLAGRSKDMLICGGFNIYPQEVAAVVAACPGVDEVAVVGMRDPGWGEIPVAFVAGQGLERRQLVAFSRPQLGIRTPRRWELVERLPRTPAGKVDVGSLQARLTAVTGRSRS
jgi:acyl-CoA synthetase (AMP-forming)/AMP-acid ligase II